MWPGFFFTCRSLFIISTHKLGVSRNFLPIGIVLNCFYLFIFYFEKFSTWIWRLLLAIYMMLKLPNNNILRSGEREMMNIFINFILETQNEEIQCKCKGDHHSLRPSLWGTCKKKAWKNFFLQLHNLHLKLQRPSLHLFLHSTVPLHEIHDFRKTLIFNIVGSGWPLSPQPTIPPTPPPPPLPLSEGLDWPLTWQGSYRVKHRSKKL